ncbi:MAG: hypothetical protein Q9220_007470 [cf. Caloplaca sp. 1 TL-2023]
MPSTSTSPSIPGTKSGIITSTGGERHIPASVRADGSTRKEIKIRPGYKPPEDVEVYKNRTAEAWKGRGASAGVPGAEAVDQDHEMQKNSKNAKRREARRRAKATDENTVDGADGHEAVQNIEGIPKQRSVISKDTSPENFPWRSKEDSVPDPVLDPEAEKEKQARNLKKKLRQARELREKREKGENLLPEQFAKVIKMSELIRQLDSLGFDAEGERKDS